MYLLISHVCYFDILKSSKIDDVGFVYEVSSHSDVFHFYHEVMRMADVTVLHWSYIEDYLFIINVYCSSSSVT